MQQSAAMRNPPVKMSSAKRASFPPVYRPESISPTWVLSKRRPVLHNKLNPVLEQAGRDIA